MRTKHKSLEVEDTFETPFTNVSAVEGEVVRLTKHVVQRGYYNMEGVRGFEYFHVKKPIQSTSLQVKNPNGEWETLMVDDPLHWYGMEELAGLANAGSVLVTGLGMGLVLHHLVKRGDITIIQVVEVDPEIIKFVQPYLPSDERISILNRDYFSSLSELRRAGEDFGTAIIDLWTLSADDSKKKRKWVATCMKTAQELTEFYFPSARILIWGIRGYRF